ncbi:hypothetical protein ACFXJ6_21060 [Streptomyces sp. NPDC059218]|uniref:hypothetical protein n=1 Tax=unclassified Streptomyces TaxID=2593676 RepID=UPI0036BC8E8C
MNDQHTPRCGSVQDVLPCILTEDHGGMYHEDTNGHRWRTAAAMRQAAEDLRPVSLDALLDCVATNLPDEPSEKGTARPATEAAIHRTALLMAAAEADDAVRLFPDTLECATAIGALQGLAVRFRRLADEAQQAAPAVDFYQPGHTYTSSAPSLHGWKFRCDAVTTHPENGERTAIGWRLFCAEWEIYDYREGDWAVQNFSEVGLVDEGGAR